MSNLDTLIGERISNLDMKIYHTINDYMVGNNYVKPENIQAIHDKVNKLNYKEKSWIGFEIAAFELGFITEKDLIEIISDYRNIGVVTKDEINKMSFVFDNFSYELCNKYKFVEYISNESKLGTILILSSFSNTNEVNEMLKRKYSNFKIRYTIPKFIEQILKDQQ